MSRDVCALNKNDVHCGNRHEHASAFMRSDQGEERLRVKLSPCLLAIFGRVAASRLQIKRLRLVRRQIYGDETCLLRSQLACRMAAPRLPAHPVFSTHWPVNNSALYTRPNRGRRILIEISPTISSRMGHSLYPLCCSLFFKSL